MIPQARNINEVIILLNNIIGLSKNEQSTHGYFAALYLKVTKKVKEGIDNGEFENGSRMEELDVVFANRYIKAYYEYKKDEQTTLSWQAAFKEADDYWIIVLQHLLLGMNAHINLDLGIAAAQVCPNEQIYGLKNDFDKINVILSSLVSSVEESLASIWPFLNRIIKKTKKVDSLLIDFSMEKARDGAWKYALQLAPLQEDNVKEAIHTRDKKIAELASLITNPSWLVSLLLKIMRLFEKGSIEQKIKDLEK